MAPAKPLRDLFAGFRPVPAGQSPPLNQAELWSQYSNGSSACQVDGDSTSGYVVGNAALSSACQNGCCNDLTISNATQAWNFEGAGYQNGLSYYTQQLGNPFGGGQCEQYAGSFVIPGFGSTPLNLLAPYACIKNPNEYNIQQWTIAPLAPGWAVEPQGW